MQLGLLHNARADVIHGTNRDGAGDPKACNQLACLAHASAVFATAFAISPGNSCTNRMCIRSQTCIRVNYARARTQARPKTPWHSIISRTAIQTPGDRHAPCAESTSRLPTTKATTARARMDAPAEHFDVHGNYCKRSLRRKKSAQAIDIFSCKFNYLRQTSGIFYPTNGSSIARLLVNNVHAG
ncbi:hypothetical protein [Dyella sp. C9]|uniref:hypothetical protein n=1 Tax=Dyella sp. C9 TaxID=2202154 RepID=UPI00130093C4|nr:hypothetical protein [Dyella sp. C9]